MSDGRANTKAEPKGKLERAIEQSGEPQSSAPSVWQQAHELLCFRIGGNNYAMHTKHVSAVVIPRFVTELPKAPSYVLGVFNHHGRVMAVLDLGVLEGKERTVDARRMVVVEAGGLDAALPIHEVYGIVTKLGDAIEPRPPHMDTSPYVTGQLLSDSRVHFVLDGARLLESARVGGARPG